MPTYEYHCRSCGRSFSVRERIDQHDARGAVCPECRSREVERVISDFYPRTPRKS